MISIQTHRTLTLYSEPGLTVTNEQGKVVSERIKKTDLNTTARLATGVDQPTRITVERKQRIQGFTEEGAASEALASAYNALRKTQYRVEKKEKEDSDYADRKLISKQDNPDTLNVQVRHLDDKIISQLGRQGKFDGDRTPDELIRLVQDAINDKARVDSKVKAETILLLIIPTALGSIIREDLEKYAFNFQGFREIWLSPFHEEAFPLTAN